MQRRTGRRGSRGRDRGDLRTGQQRELRQRRVGLLGRRALLDRLAQEPVDRLAGGRKYQSALRAGASLVRLSLIDFLR